MIEPPREETYADFRMDPAYYTFYYSQRPLDPRLPPPLIGPHNFAPNIWSGSQYSQGYTATPNPKESFPPKEQMAKGYNPSMGWYANNGHPSNNFGYQPKGPKQQQGGSHPSHDYPQYSYRNHGQQDSLPSHPNAHLVKNPLAETGDQRPSHHNDLDHGDIQEPPSVTKLIETKEDYVEPKALVQDFDPLGKGTSLLDKIQQDFPHTSSPIYINPIGPDDPMARVPTLNTGKPVVFQPQPQHSSSTILLQPSAQSSLKRTTSASSMDKAHDVSYDNQAVRHNSPTPPLSSSGNMAQRGSSANISPMYYPENSMSQGPVNDISASMQNLNLSGGNLWSSPSKSSSYGQNNHNQQNWNGNQPHPAHKLHSMNNSGGYDGYWEPNNGSGQHREPQSNSHPHYNHGPKGQMPHNYPSQPQPINFGYSAPIHSMPMHADPLYMEPHYMGGPNTNPVTPYGYAEPNSMFNSMFC